MASSCMDGVHDGNMDMMDISDDDMNFEVKSEEQNQLHEDHFNFPNSSTCWVCNGYYGPNFDEPLCSTCHAFLYNTEHAEELETTISDDEDSGNDEPPFKDKTEDDDDDPTPEPTMEEDQNDDVVEDEVDDVELEVDNDLPEDQPALQAEHEAPERPMALERPRPSAPRSLPQLMELLCEARANANEVGIGALRPSMRPNHILSFPVEIMVIIFSYLDDMSMWKASEVCKQWHDIIAQNTSQQMWRKYFKERWPLFQNLAEVTNWMKLYGALMSSCFCRTCLLQMALKTPPRRQNVIRANFLSNDFRLLNSYATEGIEAIPLDKQNTYWQASIQGPPGSPYEGGKFFIVIFFPERYPMIPPTVRFLTKILHPNVSRHGDVGIDIFQHNWSLALNVSKVLLSVQSLLTDPYTEVCMEPDLGYMYEHNRCRFESLARSWTWKYAMFELIPPR
ncbi:modifier of rpr and grim, ubiquitously expressed [Haematobia irritans]|uniref:modifier of rpr and grim, ubiquitously expressed n=1 Tax=Haematobia irritans TaxID=7368 RepID=UPI003F506D58